MEKKEILKELAKAYVADIKKDLRIYEALRAEGIDLNETHNVYTGLVEKLLDEVSIDFATALCDFATNGYVDLIEPDKHITDLDELINEYIG